MGRAHNVLSWLKAHTYDSQKFTVGFFLTIGSIHLFAIYFYSQGQYPIWRPLWSALWAVIMLGLAAVFYDDEIWEMAT